MSISGASYTIHMTREASNSTTATNYALEGEIRDKPSVLAIPGKAGSEGPWLELIPDAKRTYQTQFSQRRIARATALVHVAGTSIRNTLSWSDA
jgi:hypothetical protein